MYERAALTEPLSSGQRNLFGADFQQGLVLGSATNSLSSNPFFAKISRCSVQIIANIEDPGEAIDRAPRLAGKRWKS